MLNHSGRRASRMLVVPFVANVCLFWDCDTRAQSTLPPAQEPSLAEPGDRYAGSSARAVHDVRTDIAE